MSDLFDFDAQVDRYAVMGNPIAHSQSPRIHARFAAQTGQRLDYSAIQVDLGGFSQAVGNFVASRGKGLNITVPFKQEAFMRVTQRTPRAERAGAVNTIKIDKKNLLGDTTDGVGLVTDLIHNHGLSLRQRRILLMGAGGAARGVIEPLMQQKPDYLVIANRTPDKAVALAQLFSDLGTIHGSGYEQLADQQFDLVINATAASLQGEMPELPDECLVEGACCYDMMYGKVTQFMHWAGVHGAGLVVDGLGMLVEQAAESFYLWRGVRPHTAPVIQALRDLNTASRLG
ncbi:MAG: shikimate dehydrogenase [Gammaproteobacteria bacterium]|nr:shikimate dehydrogenase [Gammaproteobacteria bacterium]